MLIFNFEASIPQAFEVLRFNRILVRNIELDVNHVTQIATYLAMLVMPQHPPTKPDREVTMRVEPHPDCVMESLYELLTLFENKR